MATTIDKDTDIYRFELLPKVLCKLNYILRFNKGIILGIRRYLYLGKKYRKHSFSGVCYLLMAINKVQIGQCAKYNYN